MGERRGGRRPGAVLAEAEGLRAAAGAVVADHRGAVEQVRAAYLGLRDRLVADELGTIPTARLRDVTEGRLRVGALEAAGLGTVRQVAEASRYTLQLIPGVGAQTAAQALAAAGQIARAVEQTVAVRLDVDRQDPLGTALVVALQRLVAAGPEARRASETAERVQAELEPLVVAAQPARGVLRGLFAGRERRARAQAAVEQLEKALAGFGAQDVPVLLAQASVDLLRPPVEAVEAWTDFELRSADYYGVLGGIVEEAGAELAAAEGFLPEELSDRVRAEPLDDTHCRVSLRGYQAFGARFVLARKRVIIGDEMGLGKTIQAIAVLAHLRARGSTHFLVVCPASVLINWTREVESRSTLRAYRVHGQEREAALAEWLREGGVAVVTFDGLRRLEPAGVAEAVTVGMVVVDEAHFVKNRAAQRSRAVAAWVERVERVLFLTGTPMENRVEEFRSLVQYLQPELMPEVRPDSAAAGPVAFRKAVAPAYLRRNQQDVLTELPEVVHVDEWEEFSPADLAAYRSAVAAGNFPAMRRAGYADPADSAKLRRLLEIVGEAAESGLKVVVFSFFRDVLAAVREALEQRPFGPIDGSLGAARRQEVVDGFSAVSGHAVLLCQIQAGGVGLNIQAASVVILCEPQVKPTLEEQAVARSRRMGQVRRVRVHRLLAADSVDQRMLDLLRAKGRLFDDYARRSEVAESTPEAVDVSERSLAELIVEEEQLRLAARAGAQAEDGGQTEEDGASSADGHPSASARR
ncbi:DEAD/DEAH box helicase [Streptomyces sp. CBMA156]|uniref:DEAD/DEAH box helicase n=1 Tax=Streptomyces sp. CBMA156 TaxID=1930280 RepID=UPI001D7FB44C|nr:DEAD/DEAH box helicase [Streptomyces sp. CBMA156]MBD0671988.1 helicase SNF2 [Streptomyces sp. CBMA156]